jgi:type II secretory pathway predicted ATPase ExeA
MASRTHEAAMQGLTRCIRDGAGLLVLTGEAGSGKTTLFRRLAAELARTVDPIVCRGSGLDFGQLVNFVCAEVGLTHTRPTPKSELGALTDHLSVTARRPLALLVDDADRLEGTALEQLLGLRQAIEGTRQRLHLVLSGRRGLQAQLKRERATFPLVRQGIFVRIGRLSDVEAATLVERVAARRTGPGPSSIEPAGLRAIVQSAGGNPGRLAALCNAALRQAQAAGEQSVAADTVDVVLRGAQRGGQARAPKPEAPAQASGPSPAAAHVAADPTKTPRRRALLANRNLERILIVACVLVAAGGLRMLWPGSSPTADSPPQATVPDSSPAPAKARPEHEVANPAPAVTAGRDAVAGAAATRSDRIAAAPPSPQPTPRDEPRATPAPTQEPAQAPRVRRETPTPPPVMTTSPPAAAAPATPREVTPTRPDTAAQPAPASTRPPTRRERVRAHLARARSAMKRNALTTPAHDNAVRWTESALAVDRGNAAAIALLREIIDRYLGWSNRSLASGALADATVHLDRVRDLSAHATEDQLAAAAVLEDQIAARERERTRASRRRYQMEAPKWLNDLDAWVRDLPLPRE